MNEVVQEKTIINGKEFIIETGKLAKQANGAVLVRYGDTVLLVTAVASEEPKEDIDFFPLTVEFEEKFYAAGKIPGGFIKREGKPGEKAILSARLIDRPIRPLFPDGFRNEVQVIATVLSVDQENPPDILGITGASAALTISDIPFGGPIAGVRIGYRDGEYLINPTSEELEESLLDLVVAGTKDAITMVEAGAQEVSEEVIVKAFEIAQEEIAKLVELQERLRAKVGKEKMAFEPPDFSNVTEKIKELELDNIKKALLVKEKKERERNLSVIKKGLKERFEEDEEFLRYLNIAFEEIVKEEVRNLIVTEKRRVDGRSLTEIRPITCEVGVLPRTHGSAIFTRGQTQALVITTLGATEDEQIVDDITEEENKKFMLHYNFPPFSVGEVRPRRGPGRREIGHGALAERAIKAVLPPEEEFPYTIRVVSEILESNGSSSMATVCGATLSLMDAGVGISKPVSGIAMGLIKEKDEFFILTDILGLEDHYGDMDFKVAGTKDGITALQMDIKISGISSEVMRRALSQAKEARLFILDKMTEVIDKPREDLSPYAPRIKVLTISANKIGDLIGPGGKNIKKIIEETGVKINIEPDGKVYVFSTTENAFDKAQEMIEALTREAKVGENYLGKVTRITNFGAFVEIFPGKEGLVHISNLSTKRVKNVKDVVNVGDKILVKVIDIDDTGRVNLSRKAVIQEEEEKEKRPNKGGKVDS